LAHKVIEAEKPYHLLPASWTSKKAGIVTQSESENLEVYTVV
jgi:hypothetical protein